MKTRGTMPPSGRTILLVDDQQDMRNAVRTLLECDGHRVVTAESIPAALAELARETVQVMIVAWGSTSNARELIQRIRHRDPLVQVVLQAEDPIERTPRERKAWFTSSSSSCGPATAAWKSSTASISAYDAANRSASSDRTAPASRPC